MKNLAAATTIVQYWRPLKGGWASARLIVRGYKWATVKDLVPRWTTNKEGKRELRAAQHRIPIEDVKFTEEQERNIAMNTAEEGTTAVATTTKKARKAAKAKGKKAAKKATSKGSTNGLRALTQPHLYRLASGVKPDSFGGAKGVIVTALDSLGETTFGKLANKVRGKFETSDPNGTDGYTRTFMLKLVADKQVIFKEVKEAKAAA